MANMSYCRFQNTLNDLRDCLGALGGSKLSNEEKRAARNMFNTFLGFCEEEGIIESDAVDDERIEELVNSGKEEDDD